MKKSLELKLPMRSLRVEPHHGNWYYLEWLYHGSGHVRCLNTDSHTDVVNITTMLINGASSETVDDYISKIYGDPTDNL